MSEINNMTCESGKQVLDLLKIASSNASKLQTKLSICEFQNIAQPIDAVINYIEHNNITIP